VAIVLAGAAAVGCGHSGVVQRAYDGNVVDGRYVSPEAYAAFLRGAIAEAEKRPADAIAAYAEAAQRDPGSPEPWTRIAEVRCATNAREHEREAEAAIARALAIDPGYARAWSARATCAEARGDAASAREAAARAASLDPAGDGANILLARAEPARAAASRDALVALTVTAHDPAAAWAALVGWAEAHGDVAVWTRALVELARVAPEKRDAVARAAEALAGVGDVAEARAAAAAAVDASPGPLPERFALAARLAVDEAIARGDADAVRRRATRGRLPLDEAAGRAWLGGQRGLARDLAAVNASADPAALGARLVLAVVEGRSLGAVASLPRAGDTPASSAAVVAFGIAAIRAGASADARSALAVMPWKPIVAGDDCVLRPAVDLVSRGALPVDALPADGLVELAIVEGSTSLQGGLDADDARFDLRHHYLALALAHPDAPAVRELGAHLRTVAPADPVVSAASALLQLASGAPISAAAPRDLLARNPADPLLAATALRLAERVGDTDVARRARETLTALGKPRHTLD
jgi:Tfp pilus assembly protein PilF